MVISFLYRPTQGKKMDVITLLFLFSLPGISVFLCMYFAATRVLKKRGERNLILAVCVISLLLVLTITQFIFSAWTSNQSKSLLIVYLWTDCEKEPWVTEYPSCTLDQSGQKACPAEERISPSPCKFVQLTTYSSLAGVLLITSVFLISDQKQKVKKNKQS